jgi:hypothetical protein
MHIQRSKTQGTQTLGWMFGIMGFCAIFATCSGVVCLVSGILGFLKGRKNSNNDTEIL